ncbi:MAG: PfkB family carbohydrate kinase [Pseudomonadota bacterium]
MSGIACAGNWVLDRSKFIKYYPEISGHTTIYKSVPSIGGGALNALAALTKLQPDFPLHGMGLIAGETLRGKELMRLCKEENINMDFVKSVPGQSSFTDAMILPDGSRTQFHCPGVNDLFKPEDVSIDQLKAAKVKLFYLGHLMILAGMDAADETYGVKSARLLHDVQQAGIKTVIDIISNPSLSYEKLVLPALPYADYLICNEFEAEQITKDKIRRVHGRLSLPGLKNAAEKMLRLGVKNTVVIHSPESSYAMDCDGNQYHQNPLKIPADCVIDTCGAGDTFCAGMLYGIHEDWDMQKCLLLASCTAGAAVTSNTNTAGILPLADTLALADKWPPETSNVVL